MVNSTGYILGFQLIIWLKIYLNVHVHVHDLYKIYHVLYIKKISSDRELGYSFISYSLSFLDFTKDMILKKETFLDMYLTITDPLFHYNHTYLFGYFIQNRCHWVHRSTMGRHHIQIHIAMPTIDMPV